MWFYRSCGDGFVLMLQRLGRAPRLLPRRGHPNPWLFYSIFRLVPLWRFLRGMYCLLLFAWFLCCAVFYWFASG